MISYVNQTKNYIQFCHAVNQTEDGKLFLFQDASFTGDLRHSQSTSGGLLCVFGPHTFVPISWVCNKQTAVSHSSADSEVISLDAGLRTDGLTALQFWDFVLETLSCKPSMGNLERHTRERVIPPSHSHFDNCVFESIDHVQPNNPNRSLSTKLYPFVDNAAVQMINKGRSPNLRHVTKTLSVDLDWLFGRVNLDHSILIKYARTNDQLVDISRKGMFATMQRHLSLHL